MARSYREQIPPEGPWTVRVMATGEALAEYQLRERARSAAIQLAAVRTDYIQVVGPGGHVDSTAGPGPTE